MIKNKLLLSLLITVAYSVSTQIQNLKITVDRNNKFKAVEELKEKYPDAPFGSNQGGYNKMSTYFHLIVNYLEYDAIKQLAGSRAAKTILKKRYYYKWIYKQIINDPSYFKDLLIRHHLEI